MEGYDANKRIAWKVFAVVLGIYSLVAWDRVLEPSPQFHFVDLAHSWMSGRLDTDTPRQRKGMSQEGDPDGYREIIARTLDGGGWNDWASLRTLTLEDGTVVRGRFAWPKSNGERKHMFHTLDGEQRKIVIPGDLSRTCGSSGRGLCRETHHYISFPPFPGVVMLPLAAIWGYEVNDVVVTALFGAVNAALLFLFLQLLVARGHSDRSVSDNLWWTAMFAVGSVVFFSSVRGEVWFTALVFGVTLNLLFMMAALDLKRPLLAGLCLGLGMATRTPIAFCFVFFGWQLFFPRGRWEPSRWPEILRKGTLFSIPILACGGLLIAYNMARFGLPFEFGHGFLGGGAGDRIRDHGLFNTWYLDANLKASLLNLPELSTEAPFVRISKHGVGLLFGMPCLLLLARPAVKRSLALALWAAVVCAAVPGLLYQNTGWEQFSYRFAMDYLPYLVGLLAIGGRPLNGLAKGLILWGIAVNLFGAITFGRFPGIYH